MRLSAEDIAAIRRLVQARFGAGAGIRLFGSRLDDSARGGDVDLYVEPDRLPEDNLLLASTLTEMYPLSLTGRVPPSAQWMTAGKISRRVQAGAGAVRFTEEPDRDGGP